LEDINEMLRLAKLHENDLLPTSQTVYFTQNKLYSDDYKLLELDQHLLEELKEGQTLYIKGDDDENAVLCSGTVASTEFRTHWTFH
jgi:sister chromatid cohesion protein DCC1